MMARSASPRTHAHAHTHTRAHTHTHARARGSDKRVRSPCRRLGLRRSSPRLRRPATLSIYWARRLVAQPFAFFLLSTARAMPFARTCLPARASTTALCARSSANGQATSPRREQRGSTATGTSSLAPACWATAPTHSLEPTAGRMGGRERERPIPRHRRLDERRVCCLHAAPLILFSRAGRSIPRSASNSSTPSRVSRAQGCHDSGHVHGATPAAGRIDCACRSTLFGIKHAL